MKGIKAHGLPRGRRFRLSAPGPWNPWPRWSETCRWYVSIPWSVAFSYPICFCFSVVLLPYNFSTFSTIVRCNKVVVKTRPRSCKANDCTDYTELMISQASLEIKDNPCSRTVMLFLTAYCLSNWNARRFITSDRYLTGFGTSMVILRIHDLGLLHPWQVRKVTLYSTAVWRNSIRVEASVVIRHFCCRFPANRFLHTSEWYTIIYIPKVLWRTVVQSYISDFWYAPLVKLRATWRVRI